MMEVEVKEGTAPLAVDEDLPDDIEMAEDALLHTPSSGPDQGKNKVSGHLTQLYSVDFSQSRIGVKSAFSHKRTIKVSVSCC